MQQPVLLQNWPSKQTQLLQSFEGKLIFPGVAAGQGSVTAASCWVDLWPLQEWVEGGSFVSGEHTVYCLDEHSESLKWWFCFGLRGTSAVDDLSEQVSLFPASLPPVTAFTSCMNLPMFGSEKLEGLVFQLTDNLFWRTFRKLHIQVPATLTSDLYKRKCSQTAAVSLKTWGVWVCVCVLGNGGVESILLIVDVDLCVESAPTSPP